MDSKQASMKMTKQEESHVCFISLLSHRYALVVLHRTGNEPQIPLVRLNLKAVPFSLHFKQMKYTLYKHLVYFCPQEKTAIPELILERSHFLMQSWCTYCRLPVHLQGSIRGLELDCSPIWQIRHRSPSSSSESSNRRLKSKKGV